MSKGDGTDPFRRIILGTGGCDINQSWTDAIDEEKIGWAMTK